MTMYHFIHLRVKIESDYELHQRRQEKYAIRVKEIA